MLPFDTDSRYGSSSNFLYSVLFPLCKSLISSSFSHLIRILCFFFTVKCVNYFCDQAIYVQNSVAFLK